MRNIDPIKSPKEQIIEELNKNNKTSQSETQSDDKSKENHKRFIDTINQNLVEIEDIFLTKLADLYLDSQDQQK
ncbi:MAG TPA: hypothetical protein P5052_02120 [Candidatus Paceibacterota bacterium]|nr:hypothetical protein [Candidatus Paceibacterota bacterium]HRZ29546.1 hypothetical protein [Candidatus Paceibacterota bacterium]